MTTPDAAAPLAPGLCRGLTGLPLAWAIWCAVCTTGGTGIVLTIGCAAVTLGLAIRTPGWHRCRVLWSAAFTAAVIQAWTVQPYDPAWFELYSALLIGGAAAGLLFERQVGALLPSGLWRVFDRLALSTILLVIGAEFALRVLASWRPTPMFVRGVSPVDVLLESHRYPPGVLRFGFPTNRQGYYDEDFERGDARYAILTLGDSFSTGIVPHYHHYTTVAERSFSGARLHNMGFPKTGPGGYLYMLEHDGLELDTDAVVVSLYVGNDLEESAIIDDQRSPLAAWLDRDNLLLYLLPSRALLIAGETQRLGKSGRRPGQVQGERDASERVTGTTAIASRYPWTADPSLEQATFSAEQYLRIETDRVRDNSSAAERGLYTRLALCLQRIRDRIQPRPLLCQIIPDEYQVNDKIWQQVCANLAPSEPDRDEPQRRFRASCRDLDIPCLDLLPLLRAAKPLADGHRHVYHVQDTHLNTRGNAIVGRALASFLREHLDKD